MDRQMYTVAVYPVMQNSVGVITNGRFILVQSRRNRTYVHHPDSRTDYKQQQRPRVVFAGVIDPIQDAGQLSSPLQQYNLNNG
ncbi:hypothetical protein D3C73_965890 [compost metagenome]